MRDIIDRNSNSARGFHEYVCPDLNFTFYPNFRESPVQSNYCIMRLQFTRAPTYNHFIDLSSVIVYARLEEIN